MATDSLAERLTASDHPLFRFGDSSERFESVVHSLLLILTVFVVGAVLASVGLQVLETAGLTGPVAESIGGSVFQFSAFILVSVGYLQWRTEQSLVGIQRPDRRDIGAAVVGSVLLIGFMLASQLLLSRLGVSIAENIAIQRGRENPVIFLIYLPLVLLLFVPAEELLFRGVIQGLFREAYGIVPGILAASAIFGLIHYPSLVGDGNALVYVGIAAVSGIILGIVYELAGNIVVPVAVHAVWNSIVYLNAYANATGIL